MTLPSRLCIRVMTGLGSGELVRWLRMMNGKSDQGGCCSIHWISGPKSAYCRASPVMTARPAPSPLRLATSSPRLATISAVRPAPRKSDSATTPSRPRGARINARSELIKPARLQQWIVMSIIGGNAAQDAEKVRQWLANGKPGIADAIFADGVLVAARAFLDHRYGAPHASFCLEIAQQDHAVG